MPEKDGAEEKSTKSVVNKKQKQMMGEEGYDIARDMGRVRPSKDKKDATTMPPSKEMRKTQKVNKGPSALDIVKKKYKGQIMNVGKKKVKEELDLTQVAEAFGGYIIESEIRKIGDRTYFYPAKGEKEAERKLRRQLQPTRFTKRPKPISKSISTDKIPDPFDDDAEGKTKAKQVAKKEIEKDLDFDPRFDAERKEREGQFSTDPTGQKFKEPVSGTPKAKGFTAKPGTQKFAEYPGAGPVKIIKPGTKPKSSTPPPPKLTPDQIRASQDAKRQQKGKDRIIDVDAGETTGELERTASAKIEKPKPEPPKIGQFQGPQMTPLQKSKRFTGFTIGADGKSYNKTFVSPEDSKNITGADPETGKMMFIKPGVSTGKPRKSRKASPAELRRTRQAIKDLENDPREKTIISPKTGGKLPANSPQALQYAQQSDDYKERVQGIDPKTGEALSPEERKRRFKGGTLATQNKGGPVTIVPKDRSIISQNPLAMAIKKADKLVQRNPVLGGLSGLAAYDVGKGIFSKIMNLRGPGVRGGTVGRRSAGTFTAT